MERFNTLVNEERLCIVSDLHLGNPAFVKGDKLSSFLSYMSTRNSSLCINGDVIDLLQFSMPKLMADLSSLLQSLQSFSTQGKNNIYYIIGNHDIYMEAFLESSGIFEVVPYLDVVSGGQRIHIEHGHLYDRLFLFFPRLYIQMAKLLGLAVLLSPRFFHLWFKIWRLLQWFRNRKDLKLPNPPIDDPGYMEAAIELFERGFDTVIFGHTHHTGIQDMWNNKIYANPGSWTGKAAHYICIDKGEIRLMEWE